MSDLFLHEVPYHVHRTFGALQIVSWVVIAVGGAALGLSWGRIIAWLREDETVRRPRLVHWGRDEGGWFAELRDTPRGMAWRAEYADGRLAQPTVTHSGRSTWVRVEGPQPVRLIDEAGTELLIPGESG